MGIKEVPKSYVYTCDCCGNDHEQKNAGGHYTDSRPPGWSRIILTGNVQNFTGENKDYASIEYLLCKTCGQDVYKALNNVTEEIRQLVKSSR